MLLSRTGISYVIGPLRLSPAIILICGKYPDHFYLDSGVEYSYTKDAIAPVFQSDDTNIIETYSNLNNAQNIKASLFLQWYPFTNNILNVSSA